MTGGRGGFGGFAGFAGGGGGGGGGMVVVDVTGPYDEAAGGPMNWRGRAAHPEFVKYTLDRPNKRGLRPYEIAEERHKRIMAVETWSDIDRPNHPRVRAKFEEVLSGSAPSESSGRSPRSLSPFWARCWPS